MTTLEARGYVATEKDIEALTLAYDAARTQAGSAGGTYLRALVATVQSDLGIKARERAASGPSVDTPSEERARQLAAFERINETFYGVVLRGLSGDSMERNRKSGFARSAGSTLRRWIRSGHDVGRLAAARVTRDALEAAIPADKKRAPRVRLGVMGRRAARGSGLVVAAAVAADKAERGAGVAMLQKAMGEISAALIKMGGVAAERDVAVAVRERVPFKKGKAMFWPVSG